MKQNDNGNEDEVKTKEKKQTIRNNKKHFFNQAKIFLSFYYSR